MTLNLIDSFVTGSHPLAGLMALRMLNGEKKVVLFNDQSNNWNKQYFEHFGGLEKAFLISWGVDDEIETLKNVSDYLTQKTVTFVIDGIAISLGSSPSRNLVEMARKFNSLFSEENLELIESIFLDQKSRDLFDSRFESLSSRISLNCFRYRTLETLTPAIFETHCPENVKILFRNFYDNLIRPEHRSLIFTMSAFYNQSITTKIGELEAIYLFISLLSPLFYVDSERLFADLLKEFTQRNGIAIESENNPQYRLKNRKLLPMQFKATEENVFKFGMHFFFGDKSVGDHVFLTSEKILYQAITIELKNVVGNHLSKGTYIICNQDFLGSEVAYWSLDISDEMVFSIRLYLEDRNGLDLIRMKKRLMQFIIKQFKGFGIRISEENFEDFEFLAEYLPMEWSGLTKRKENLRLPLDNHVFFRKMNGSRTRIRNAYGFTPLRSEPLGLFSLLLQIKNKDSFTQ